ncbi:PIN domain-containing protein [Halorussus salilacus]|uniref:PIN domain-containing protein n=1 Tax=Halorussus salilacus TaxID=2953750 RepID=UPI00209F0170|nr:PIN domain-containing protein [Halorussus salilacus]USZ66958.1 PIN domain-containing protein [Halorussus salilacus]
MKVLDSSFLMDYEDGHPTTKEYLLDHSDEAFVVPAPIYTEFLLGGVYGTESTPGKAKQNLEWVEVHSIGEETAEHATEIAAEIDAQGPHLSPIDALVAGASRELDAPLVTSDSDHTHPSCREVIDIEEYR